jgi:nucleotide-binding universal stress UspA family protein
MDLPKRILVPTDFTDTSDAALDYAIALAALTGGQVTVMHAFEMPIVGFPDGAMIASGDVVGNIMTASENALAALIAKRSAAGVPLKTCLRQGVNYEEVNAVAAEIDADLIVIGTHGRRGIARALLGSVAENVIRTATRPVLTIHGPRDGVKPAE